MTLPTGPLPTTIDVRDSRMRPIIAHQPALERLCTGARWSEGPVWMHEDDSVVWSDIPNDRMLRWSAADGMREWQRGVEFTNGHARDLDGTLLHCSHGLRAVYRTEPDGSNRRIVVDRWQGKRLNAPNDIVVKSDATLWFTDPPYGLIIPEEGHGGESEIGDFLVFRYDARSGVLDAVSDLAIEPNGLAFSPDERLLYVSDTSAALGREATGEHCIWVFDVVSGTRLANGRKFTDVAPGVPDGFRIDVQGWIYTSSDDSVQVYHPDGTLLGKILVPEKVGNVTFGGMQRDVLYIVASTSLYRIRLRTQGVQRP
ncbi:MAG TPA: SMP-30/gluconolactonase/LRE family protein [Casimicrobiaceae bacterium]|nr:SMP-30/gluconolactonase/LRE family protein [Casimicrobiaceae bacterium]